MYQDQKIWLGKAGDEKIYIYPRMANRHGMIAGATGTGKTITLKVLAESFSDCGVPVFLADVKGDLAGMCQPGVEDENIQKRMLKFGLREEGYTLHSYPTVFWDVYGEKGIPLRTTISEMGPLLMARILGLNAIQSDLMTVIFKIADDEGLLLIDTKDLKAMIQYVGEKAKEYQLAYGNIPRQSLGAITRAIVALEAEGGEQFFAEPALNIQDWFKTDENGRGQINILDCQKLINNPTMYSTFLLWMMSELFETLPEVGDADKPKMVFFFDEAHMLFDSADKVLLEKIEQVVQLIRSKGVGIFFITQNPKDIPAGVLSQLGNKVQHALRAYTPSELKGLKIASEGFRVNPNFDTYTVLQELGTGEALVSVLDEKGIPTIVQQTKILPPQSLMGGIDNGVRVRLIALDPLSDSYENMVDRDSAYEFLLRMNMEEEAEQQRLKEEAAKRKEEEAAEKQRQKEEAAAERARIREEAAAKKARIKAEEAAEKQRLKEEAAAERERVKAEEAAEKARLKEEEKKKKAVESAVKSTASSAVGTVGRNVGNAIGNAIGGKFGKTLGGNIGASLGRGIIGTLFKLKG